MRTLFLISFMLGLHACVKYTCVKKSAPEMTGDWVHLSENNGFHYLYIKSNGKGSMYGVNDHDNTQDTQERGWYIKEEVLYFSRFYNKAKEDQFTIDLYPTVATEKITTLYDTVEIGTTYMKLNNRIYRKMK